MHTLRPPPPPPPPPPAISRARIPHPLFFDDLSNFVTPHSTTLDKDTHYSPPQGPNYTYAPRAQHTPVYESNASTPDDPFPDESARLNNYSLIPHSHLSPATTPSRDAPVSSARYVSHSPSPTDPHPSSSFPQPFSAPHFQDHFPGSASPLPPEMDRYSTTINVTDRYLRGSDKYPHNQHPLLDQRRMSEPAIFGSTAGGYPTPSADLHSVRYHHPHYPSPRSYSSYTPLQRGLSSSSIRDSHPLWKEEDDLHSFGHLPLDDPISPLNPTFSGGAGSPGMGIPSMPYSILDDPYGPSPPGTGTSTSSNPHPGGGPSGSSSNNKQYSFVSLPGNAVKKRPRRRYDEIERLYRCSWPDCTKAYGTLNHLNAHVTMQKHGGKRSPNEFKELRKQWRKAKKEEADARTLGGPGMRSGHHHHPAHMRHDSLSDAELHQYSQMHGSHPHHRGHLPIGIPSSLPVPPLTDARFATSASLDELRYSPSDEFDGHSHEDAYMRRQQRFSIGSWHGSSGRSNPVYLSGQHPSQHQGMGHPSSSSHVAMNRLPPDSTLLTPLPGYEPPAMIPGAMHGQPELDVYGGGGYDSVYEEDGRPGSGHSNISGYTDGRMRRNVYGEDMRPNSSHSHFRGVPDQDYP